MQKKSEAFPKKIYLKPALEERLAQILAVPLTVAAAPFGYGKTTAVKKVLLFPFCTYAVGYLLYRSGSGFLALLCQIAADCWCGYCFADLAGTAA